MGLGTGEAKNKKASLFKGRLHHLWKLCGAYDTITAVNSKKRVLVVDDEAGILRFVRISLSAAGYEVITASGGEEALQLVESQKPDIMLLDIVMEPVSGIDVLFRLRRASNKIPVIVFTAQNFIAESALSIGAKGYISKPIMPDQLVRKIEETLDAHNAVK